MLEMPYSTEWVEFLICQYLLLLLLLYQEIWKKKDKKGLLVMQRALRPQLWRFTENHRFMVQKMWRFSYKTTPLSSPDLFDPWDLSLQYAIKDRILLLFLYSKSNSSIWRSQDFQSNKWPLKSNVLAQMFLSLILILFDISNVLPTLTLYLYFEGYHLKQKHFLNPSFFSSKGMPMHFDLIILTIHMTHKVIASKHRWMLCDWILIYCWKTQLFVHFTLPFVWKVSWTLSSRCILHSHASCSKNLHHH